jgi:hypothetical protein
VERPLRIVNSQQPRHMSPRAWIEPEIREHILEMIRGLDAQGELTEEHLSATYLEKLK